jgi:CubicO group peptidase (beta-lactamase class C family)
MKLCTSNQKDKTLMRYFPALALLLCTFRCHAQDNQLATLIPVLMARANIPGLSIALIEDGKMAWVGSFGVKNTKTGDKVDPRTVFQAASLSKTVFAYGVLKLVDQGKFDLDTPLSKYVPEYVQNDYRINAITARHVLTHRTGFPNWRPDGQPLVIHFKPGDRFSYSGEGFVYLQRAVEKITGLPLDTWMRQTVFDPLQMADSSYLWQPKYDALAASGHTATSKPDQQFKPRADGSPINGGGGPAAASTLLTTARDYATFAIAVMNGTGLKKETSRAMLTQQSQVDAGCSNCIGRPITKTSETISWGLGVGIEQTARGPFFWHWGDNGDFKAFMAGSAGSRRGIVIFTNSSNGMMIIPEIAARALGETQPAFDWIHYERYDSPRMQLQQTILDRGIDEALKNYSSGQPIEEGSMNMLGYQLLALKKFKEALRIFELNAAAYPKSANVWDSLGEAYMIAGKELAIQYYRRSLDLDPGNSNASDMLKKLDAK